MDKKRKEQLTAFFTANGGTFYTPADMDAARAVLTRPVEAWESFKRSHEQDQRDGQPWVFQGKAVSDWLFAEWAKAQQCRADWLKKTEAVLAECVELAKDCGASPDAFTGAVLKARKLRSLMDSNADSNALLGVYDELANLANEGGEALARALMDCAVDGGAVADNGAAARGEPKRIEARLYTCKRNPELQITVDRPNPGILRLRAFGGKFELKGSAPFYFREMRKKAGRVMDALGQLLWAFENTEDGKALNLAKGWTANFKGGPYKDRFGPQDFIDTCKKWYEPTLEWPKEEKN